MSQLKLCLSNSDIQKRIESLSYRISHDFINNGIFIISVLKGAFVFTADLIRYLTIPNKIDFVCVSSYGSNLSSSGSINLIKPIELDISNKDIMIVDGIIDTGRTMAYLIDYARSLNPKTINICTLIDKKERRKFDIKINYSCHIIEEGFIVGYGLDFNEEYRALKDIYYLKQ